jgi:2-polyprenyl-3-methyl-5-hydroxy-6-metoxy-1,4-benzoquinol methylase
MQTPNSSNGSRGITVPVLPRIVPGLVTNQNDFQAYKKAFVVSARRILQDGPSDVLSEAALPAYANRNPLSSYLFWQRVRIVMKHLGEGLHYKAAMDYGCGSGVMLPYLSRVAESVAALDVDLSPLEKMASYMQFADNVEAYDLKETRLGDFKPESFDVILALDVLEHVDNLGETLAGICSRLRVGGKVFVSGPTENFAYKMGRKLSGPEYSGHYHVRNIYQIRDELEKFTSVNTVATLFRPVPFFEIYCCTRQK